MGQSPESGVILDGCSGEEFGFVLVNVVDWPEGQVAPAVSLDGAAEEAEEFVGSAAVAHKFGVVFVAGIDKEGFWRHELAEDVRAVGVLGEPNADFADFAGDEGDFFAETGGRGEIVGLVVEKDLAGPAGPDRADEMLHAGDFGGFRRICKGIGRIEWNFEKFSRGGRPISSHLQPFTAPPWGALAELAPVI